MKAAVDHLVAKYAGFTFDDFARDMVLCAAAVAEKETAVAARIVKPGSAEAIIPAAALARLKPGSYTIVVEAALGSEAGAVETSNLIVF